MSRLLSNLRPRKQLIVSFNHCASFVCFVFGLLVYVFVHILMILILILLTEGDKFSWLRDEEFCRQMLAGINPCSIQLVTVYMFP